jgi:chemotaxis protein MotB
MPNKTNDGTEGDQQDRINSGPSDFPSENPDESGKTDDPTAAKNKPTEEQRKALMRKREDESFEKAQKVIERTLETLPGLRKLADHLILESTEEGLRIQIIDRAKTSMFATGSSVPYQHTRQLLEVVAHAVARLPNKISIAGHTDAVPYARGASYSNWELSTDRAHASRRELSRFGVPKERFSRIVGKAATEPLITDDPRNARNRRISITLQRQNRLPPKAAPNLRPNGAPGKPAKKAAAPPPPVVKGAKLKKVIPSGDTPGR